MSRVLFTMYDIESAWESDGYANFAGYKVITSSPTDTGLVGGIASNLKPGKAPLAAANSAQKVAKVAAQAERGILAEAGHLAKRTGQLTLSTSKRGLKFLRRIGGRATGVTGRLAQRAVTGVGRGIRQVGAAIGRNPKVAGAVILGGAAVGVGGYAYSRRNKRSNNSRYLAPATFNRRYR